LGCLYLNSSSKVSQDNSSTLYIKHNQSNLNAITIENSANKTVSMNYAHRAGDTSSTTPGGLILLFEEGTKLWLYGHPTFDKQDSGGGGTTWDAEFNWSFTGVHLNLIKKSELLNIQKGMIVSSTNDICNMGTGRDLNSKESITISQSVPVVEVCKKVKSKKVYGVFSGVCHVEDGYTYVNTESGSITFKELIHDDEVRIAVNSIGEGAVLVINSNGNIEAGDFVCSSLVSGYCQRQSDDLLHSYTGAKIIIDCNFDLDSDEYECWELDNGLHCSLLPCIYKF